LTELWIKRIKQGDRSMVKHGFVSLDIGESDKKGVMDDEMREYS